MMPGVHTPDRWMILGLDAVELQAPQPRTLAELEAALVTLRHTRDEAHGRERELRSRLAEARRVLVSTPQLRLFEADAAYLAARTAVETLLVERSQVLRELKAYDQQISLLEQEAHRARRAERGGWRPSQRDSLAIELVNRLIEA